MTFPDGFVWGAATAAYQVEGAGTADGRVPSIWDAFCRVPGAVTGGDTGDVAADHYRLMEQDVRMMARLGLRAYRFSVAWPRVADLGFYDRLVDTLLANGIEPWATLYHWDLPQVHEETGGWANRDTAYHFGDYAETVLRRLGDRVPNWITLNEPWCAAFLGYASGIHAPGRTEPNAAVAAAHHLLLGHGIAMHAIRSSAPSAQAGITLNLFPVHCDDPADPLAADAVRRIDGLQNRLFLDPVVRGTYPDDVLTDLAPHGLPETIKPGDLELIRQPMDLLGVNYYRDIHVAPGADAESPSPWVGSEHVRFPDRGLPKTDSGWDIVPAGLTELLVRLRRDYPGLPVYITENGAAFPGIDDTDRVSYLDGHLRAALGAIDQGVDLRGYFLWSLMDNFEWAEGYAKRFGMVHVDFRTQVRTTKTSAHWYARVIAANALP
ncbi:GH1 family beta-glucosidase [Kibdelosporangium phytohabitans]|uniref:Beta-glucosidase n=1 Tax=Kibdelosporangium phytohabitans TaxID=860235 RepID=A0A0N9I2T3_9PSEU|nr:GH1 family beta-glucosidase [Kibdelosporangium phytohabitans]ALG09977.1 beta-glucosidase [Kibdelosporangium phytohabitans]MBE1468607.1 beta-glucosidase [Kibdelosporangium phytohabitans]